MISLDYISNCTSPEQIVEVLNYIWKYHDFVPDPKHFKKLNETHIEDENKSVRWNREFVEQTNKAYYQELNRLKKLKKDRESAAVDKMIDILASYNTLNKAQVRAIWIDSYADNHSFGADDILSGYYDRESLIKKVIKLANSQQAEN